MSRLGLGLAALGRPGYINLGHGDDFARGREVEAMRARAHEVMDEAYALGIRYFDAARSYGRAEEFIASWRPPGAVVIGSKWGYRYVADWKADAAVHEVKDHSLSALERQWSETQALLSGRLALYQIHSATLESGVLENAAVLGRLMTLRSEGVRVGLSVSGSRQGDVIRRAMEVCVEGLQLFQSVQATWNLLERSAEAALREAHDAGLGVIVKEALANGRLTPRGGAFEDDAVALAAALSKPWVDVVLSGAATLAQLRSNVRALTVDADRVALAEASIVPEAAEAYWAKRASLPWN